MPKAKACLARIQGTLIATLSLRDICELERKLSINKNKIISLTEQEYSTPSNIKRDGDYMRQRRKVGLFTEEKKNRGENMGKRQGQTRIQRGHI